jgi:prepilin-type N-terminal cleavage/methylation domain-containing protein
MHYYHNKNSGFTLIELLVVIAIIGLLSSVVLASLSGAREGARDARRLSDMNQIRTALELYYNSNGKYPGEAGCDTSIGSGGWPCPPADSGGWDTSSRFYNHIMGGEYISTLPIDPINNISYYYYYEPTNDGWQGYYFRATLENGETWGVCGGTYSNTTWCH